VDSKQRQKTIGQLVRLTSNPEVASIARSILCLPVSEESISEIPKQEEGGRRLHFIAIFLAFLSWWYTLITTEPNFWLGSLILFGAAFFLLLAAWESQSMRRRGRIISSVIVVLLFFGTDYGWYRQRLRVATDALNKSQAFDREEVHQLLTGKMDYEAGDDLLTSPFLYTNGSKIPINVESISVITRNLLFDWASFDTSSIDLVQNNKLIDGGGDGQSEPVLQRFLRQGINVASAKFVCADLEIVVKYRLRDQPEIPQEKLYRFVTTHGRNGLKWLREDVGDRHDFCRDVVFQGSTPVNLGQQTN